MNNNNNNDNAFPNGTRVFFWDASGNVKYGTVLSTSRLGDGTQLAVIKIDGSGDEVQLPVSTVSRVQ
ncbi:hypothetical protein NEOLEDRAFT_1129283 [Neolentinus lepideus HHB14362 ss-1]|uniref:Uncharacterized protein n=1 Tax=Neolentinus lepideus HHB14362 ss-1 TaxID=1314782 RepID=A0A165UPE3_9AGAM|nr:hypothetical protein NEOLEDRAFT_1129283 [Neolentinus lepideus HHB14362 ss-1]